jgi:pimeloyl-ACP methyl ester carboxylesterase
VAVALDNITIAVREQNGKEAIILVHGFHGEAYSTFGMLPAFLAGDPRLVDRDIFCFGYPTTLAPDITGVWSADPDLTALSGFLHTGLTLGAFARYEKITLVAHSMGGLIVQRALIDGGGYPGRIRQVLLFGTPSGGLHKAGLFKIFKRQVRDMDADGKFITKLRKDWTNTFGASPPFAFLAVAGVKDQFVPPASSVELFERKFQAYVSGNHLEMVKPERTSSDMYNLTMNVFTRSAIDSAAARAVRKPELTIVATALRIEQEEGVGKSLEFLRSVRSDDTDVKGVLAGRLKRLWLGDPEVNAGAGPEALELYREACAIALAKQDHEQVYYHAINCSFLLLALFDNRPLAKEKAALALDHSRESPISMWGLATEGEALLHLDDVGGALRKYNQALGMHPDPRERESMQQQAIWTARLLDNDVTEARLQALFAGGMQEAQRAGGA